MIKFKQQTIKNLSFNKKRGIPDFIKKSIDKELEEKIKEKLRVKYSFKDYYFYSVKIEDRNLLNLEFKELPSTNYRKAI